jgi:acyl carrier protein
MLSITDRVRKIIAEVLDIDEDYVTLDATFINLGADEFNMGELLISFSAVFDTNFSGDAIDAIEKFVTVRDVVSYIEANVGSNYADF